MNRLEIIDKSNPERLRIVGGAVAEAYQRAFAGPPWFEASKCDNQECGVGFRPDTVGCICPECQSLLIDAYDKGQLIAGWTTMVQAEDAVIELAFSNQNIPLRATIARPTNPDELVSRKYADVPEMRDWAAANLPDELVWIEDTFANLQRSPKGNLADRARTLGMIAVRYDVPMIATRTLAPSIVRSTVRDVGPATDIYIGSERAGESVAIGARSVGNLPDRRTFLAIDAKELRS